MKINKKGITIVELIVVITIMAILGVISFISVQSYIVDSRNVTRTTDIGNIKRSLSLLYIDLNSYPVPDGDLLNVTYSGATVWNQGVFSSKNLRQVKSLSNVPLDPLSKTPYIYSVVENQKEYEIGAIFEEASISASSLILDETYASDTRSAYVTGNYNGKVARAQTGSTLYLLAVPSIINGDLSESNLENIITNKSLVFNKYGALPGNLEGNDIFDYTPNGDIVLYQGNKDTLEETLSEQISFFSNLQNTYSGTILENNSTFSSLISLDANSREGVQSSFNILNTIFSWKLGYSGEDSYAENNSEVVLASAPEDTETIIEEEVVEEEIVEIDSNAVVPFQGFGVGFGGGSAIPFEGNNGDDIWVQSADLILSENIEYNGYYDDIVNFDANAFDQLQKKLSNADYSVYWLVDGWQESWFSVTNIQKIIDSGKIPVFSYWYFGDGITGLPTQAEQDEYLADAAKFNTFLKKLDGTKFVLMEPEFNKDVILGDDATEDAFSEILGDAIDIIKDGNTNTYFSLTMTDTGGRKTYENHCTNASNGDCSYGDETRWNQSERIYNNLIDKLDFISFQEMVSQYSRYSVNPGTWSRPNPLANTDATMGIENLDQRIVNFTKYLKAKYNKPVFLPYITVMTDTWVDSEYAPGAENFVEGVVVDDNEITKDGWLTQADDFYERLSLRHNELESEGMFGYAVMSLFDNPSADVGGFQYFIKNEYEKGIISTGAIPTGQTSNRIRPHGDLDFKGSIIDNIFR